MSTKVTIICSVVLTLSLILCSCKTNGENSGKNPLSESTTFQSIKPSPVYDTPATPYPGTKSVLKADCIVLGTITDQKNEIVTQPEWIWGGEHAYTIFTLTVEKMIKGDPATKEIFIRVPGGTLSDNIIQLPIGAYFSISEKVLVCLKFDSENTYTLSSEDILWQQGPNSRLPDSKTQEKILGWIILIMKTYQIPIALPKEDFPPIPVSTTLSSSPLPTITTTSSLSPTKPVSTPAISNIVIDNPSPVSYLTYTDPNNLFKISYPSDWAIPESNS